MIAIVFLCQQNYQSNQLRWQDISNSVIEPFGGRARAFGWLGGLDTTNVAHWATFGAIGVVTGLLAAALDVCVTGVTDWKLRLVMAQLSPSSSHDDQDGSDGSSWGRGLALYLALSPAWARN